MKRKVDTTKEKFAKNDKRKDEKNTFQISFETYSNGIEYKDNYYGFKNKSLNKDGTNMTHSQFGEHILNLALNQLPKESVSELSDASKEANMIANELNIDVADIITDMVEAMKAKVNPPSTKKSRSGDTVEVEGEEKATKILFDLMRENSKEEKGSVHIFGITKNILASKSGINSRTVNEVFRKYQRLIESHNVMNGFNTEHDIRVHNRRVYKPRED